MMMNIRYDTLEFMASDFLSFLLLGECGSGSRLVKSFMTASFVVLPNSGSHPVVLD